MSKHGAFLFGSELAGILGLEPKRISRMTLYINAGEMPRLDVTYMLIDHDLGLVAEKARGYRLEPIEADE